jgi:uncharacterized protein (TIGR03067 family)
MDSVTRRCLVSLRVPLLVCVLLLVGFAPAPFPKHQREHPDLDRIQGEWVAVSYRVWYDERRSGDASFVWAVLQGRRLTFYQAGKMTNDGTVRLSGTGHVRQIDYTEENANRAALGVYRFEDEGMTICWSYYGFRPSDFTGGKSQELMVLKRKKP